MDRIRRALAAVGALTDGGLTFAPAAVGKGQIHFVIEAGITAGADASVSRQGFTNTGVVVRIRSLAGPESWDVAAHELGHFVGFGHSPEPDIMFAGGAAQLADVSAERLFSDHLRRTWLMMAQRTPGQAFPDDDSVVGSSSTSRATLVPD